MYDVFSFSSDPILIIDCSQDTLQLIDMNDAFCEWSGYPKEQVLGTSPSQFVVDHVGISEPFERLREWVQAKAAVPWCRIRSKSGVEFDVRLEVMRISLPDSRESRYAVILHDITEQLWIDSVIRGERAFGSVILDKEMTVQSITSYTTPVRYDASTFLCQPVLQFVSVNDRRHVKRAIDYSSANRKPHACMFGISVGEHAYTARALFMTFRHWTGEVKSSAVVLLHLEPKQEEVDSSFKLRVLMTAKNVSVTELARSTHISLTTISKIRNGKIKKPKRLTAKLIADKLGVGPEEIWGAYSFSI
ncbi:helix-turn-helix domain-containing protein [Paenibacillus kobensis]|uniref:helix-turn-helix domain-containing protein n=1 Tax=Paenibacillus kobensis TaxID=59841 RepID=UPI000FDB57C5|nr:helix-turn-helix domain-containing protein [Paenibacillus kobensis]